MSDAPADGLFATAPGAEPAPGSVTAPEGEAARRTTGNGERPLRDRTFRWLATLPAGVRPIATGRQYPRIVNRIADLWGHCEYTRLHFQSLLIDRRRGRRGFPAEVRTELESLQQYYFEHLSGLPAMLWNAVPVHPSRIPHKVFHWSPSSEIDILPP